MDIELVEAYVKFFINKDVETCELTNKFLEKYRQKGGAYIELEECLRESIKKKNSKNETYKYGEYLIARNNNDELRNDLVFKWMSDEEYNALNIFGQKEKAPDQKWHLIVSYLGLVMWRMNNDTGKTSKWGSVKCPELWLWLVEVSGLFEKSEVEEFYHKAINYRSKSKEGNASWIDARASWIDARKSVREKINNEVINWLRSNRDKKFT